MHIIVKYKKLSRMNLNMHIQWVKWVLNQWGISNMCGAWKEWHVDVIQNARMVLDKSKIGFEQPSM